MLRKRETPFSAEVDVEAPPLGIFLEGWPLVVGFESEAESMFARRLVWDLVAIAEMLDMAGGARAERGF